MFFYNPIEESKNAIINTVDLINNEMISSADNLFNERFV